MGQILIMDIINFDELNFEELNVGLMRGLMHQVSWQEEGKNFDESFTFVKFVRIPPIRCTICTYVHHFLIVTQ